MGYSQKNIEKARELYLTKGILKRELLRDEVVYSWVRSRLINLDSSKIPEAFIPLENSISYDDIIQKLALNELGIEVNQLDILSILHVSEGGKILNAWSKTPLSRHYFNFLEDSIGTSGLGLAARNQSKSIVIGYEHYHDFMLSRVSIGIPSSDNSIVGIILEFNKEPEIFHKLNSRLPEAIDFDLSSTTRPVQVVDTSLSDDKLKWPACLVGESILIKMARDRTLQFKDSQLLFISGPRGVGKESTAQFIHNMSKGEQEAFYAVYCDKVPLVKFYSEWLENSDTTEEILELYESGTVYLENFNALPQKFQRKFMRILDSKLVNSTAENSSNNKGVSFIMSLTSEDDDNKVIKGLTRGLQSRLKLAEISLPGLSARKEDVCPIFGHMIRANGLSINDDVDFTNEEYTDLMTSLKLECNLRDLDKIVYEIGEQVSENNALSYTLVEEVVQPFVNDLTESSQLRSLADLEKEAIETTLNALNYNMVRTANILGISRSTLYRKIEHYNITIDVVR